MKEKKERSLPTKLSWYLRMLVGAYLVFIDYQIVQSSKNTGDPLTVPVILAMVLFAAAGSLIVLWGIRGLVRGQYVGGAMDREETGIDANEKEATEDTEQ